MTRVRTTQDTVASTIQKLAAEAKKSKTPKRELAGTSPYKVENIKYVVDMMTNLSAVATGLAKSGEILASINAHDLSPDGLLGGRGYVMSIKDIRLNLTSAANIVSDLNDALADELNNPKWELSPEDIENYKEQAKGAPTAGTGSEVGSEPTADPALGALPTEDSESSSEGSAPSVDDPLTLPATFGEEAPEATEPAPASTGSTAPVAPATVSPDLPFKKLGSFVGHPERDMVSRLLRAPILFNILDGHTAGNN